MDLDGWLSEVTVSEKAVHEHEDVTWWPDELPWEVVGPEGRLGLFPTEKDALRYRLFYINLQLNPT